MDPLPPIPTPPAQRWREFRIQVLPLIVFLGVLMAVVVMWRNFVQPSGIVGEVEAVRANVISLQDGLVTDLVVNRFEKVTRDQELGHVTITDPTLLNASLAAIKADLNVMRARMKIDSTRSDQGYQGMKMDLLKAMVEKEIAFNNMLVASNQFYQTKLLYLTNVVSAAEYDIAKSNFDRYVAETESLGKFILVLEKTIQQFQQAPPDSADPIDEAIQTKERELQLTLKPTALRAPIDGMVSMIYRQPGEKVVKGEPIIVISAPYSDRIIGYIRQPIGTVPSTNDPVTVRTRTQRRQVGTGQILKIGPSLEPINPALLSPDGTRVEVGLPILVSLPPHMKVLPGEFVDISIEYVKH